MKQLIEGKIDNKTKYALDRCLEEMFKNEPYGLYKFGYTEDLEKITERDLYNQYQNLISNCKIDVFVSGFNIDHLNENEILANLNERTATYIPTDVKTENYIMEKPSFSKFLRKSAAAFISFLAETGKSKNTNNHII